MRKIRIVSDTNILVSALAKKEGNPREIFKRFLDGEIVFIESDVLLLELICVLKRSKFDLISQEEKAHFVRDIMALSWFVEPDKKLDAVEEDFMDNIVLEAAVTGEADYIVTGDEHLLKLGEFRGVRIVNAKDFLEII